MLKTIGALCLAGGAVCCSRLYCAKEKQLLATLEELFAFFTAMEKRMQAERTSIPDFCCAYPSEILRETGFLSAFPFDYTGAVRLLPLQPKIKNELCAVFAPCSREGDDGCIQAISLAVEKTEMLRNAMRGEYPKSIRAAWTLGIAAAALCLLLFW